jgi:hypothetical protein
MPGMGAFCFCWAKPREVEKNRESAAQAMVLKAVMVVFIMLC